MIRHIPQIVSAVVGLALVITGAVLLSRGEYEQGAGLIAGGLGTLALPRVRLPGRKPTGRSVIPELSIAAATETDPRADDDDIGEPDCEDEAHRPGCRRYVPPAGGER